MGRSYDYEVIKRSLDLAETMQAGIEHIRSRFAEGRFEEMLPLLHDITQALISIQQASPQGGEDLLPSYLADQINRMQVGLDQLVLAYENANWEKAVKAWENEVVPGFALWKEELERCYRPSVVS